MSVSPTPHQCCFNPERNNPLRRRLLTEDPTSYEPVPFPQLCFIDACGFERRAYLIWAKQAHTFGRGHYHWQHEPCWYAVRKGTKGHWSGSRKQSTIWMINKPNRSETGHSTQKPVECMRRPMLNNSSPGQVIYDPFLGSGTSIIAAESEGRHCYGLEIEAEYCDIIIERWQNNTDKEAQRDDGD